MTRTTSSDRMWLRRGLEHPMADAGAPGIPWNDSLTRSMSEAMLSNRKKLIARRGEVPSVPWS